MLSEDQLNIIGGAIVPIFQGLEQDVITDVARRVKKTMSLTRTAELMAMSMLELGFSAAEIMRKVMETIGADEALQAKIVENTIEYKKDIQAGIQKAISMAKTVGDELIGDAGNMAWIDDMRIWESAGKQLTDNSALGQIIEQYRKRTEGTLKNITQSAGFKTKTAVVAVRDLYQKTMDKVLTEFVGGVFNSDTCVRNAVHELAQSGIRSVDYASGRSYQLDTAARMCIQTASGQVAAGIMDDNMKKTDALHLVEVSRHWGARNVGKGYKNHEEWQGKVYSVDGEKHPEEEKRLGYPITDLQTATGYDVHTGKSEVEGLHGINCRHAHYVFFEGISEPQEFTPEPPPKVINGKKMDYFQIYQEQRRRERGIRALKREKEALKNLGMDTSDIDRKIKEQTKSYYSFCKEAGVNPQPARLRVEPNTSDLRKTQAWKDYEAEKAKVMGDSFEEAGEIKSNVKSEGTAKNNIEDAYKNSFNADSQEQESKESHFVDTTEEWMPDVPHKPVVIDAQEYEKDGVVYKVDGVNVRLDYTQHEWEIAELLSKASGKKFEMIPKIAGIFKRVSTPDFLADGVERYDLKDLKGKSKDAVRNAISKKKEQADHFVINITAKCQNSTDDITLQVENVFKAFNTQFVKEVVVIKDGAILRALKRK